MITLMKSKSVVSFIVLLLLVVFSGEVAFGDVDLGTLIPLDDSVQVHSSRVGYDRRTGQFSTTVTTANISAEAIPSPVYLVIESISSPAVTVANADGLTVHGKPYFDLDVGPDGELAPGETAAPVRVALNNPQRVRFNFVPRVYGIQLLGPEGGTFEGTGNLTVIVPAGACDEEVPIAIKGVDEEEVGKDTPPGYVFLGAADLDIGDVVFSDNADISVPCPAGVPQDAEVYVAEVVEYAGVPMFMMVDTANVQGDSITSEDPGFPGILGSGVYCFFWGQNVGWVGGQVTRKDDGSVVPKAVVTLSGGYFLDIADDNGNYMLPAWAGNFVVVAFDDVTGDHGEKQGYMPQNGASVLCNVQIGESSGPVQSNLINGDFETGDLTAWVLSGAGSVIQNLGPITPYEGGYMGMISTGSGAIGGASSALEQSFTVPAGATTLTIHYNFVSEEYWEWVGTQYNDVFNATLHTPAGSLEVAFASVNTATWYSVSGIDFPGGDNTCGQTGWLQGSIDVSEYAGTDDTLTLTVHDVGDTIYDSVVLLDEIVLEAPEPLTGADLVSILRTSLEEAGYALKENVSETGTKPLLFLKVSHGIKPGVGGALGSYFDVLDFLPTASQDGKDGYVTVWVTGKVDVGVGVGIGAGGVLDLEVSNIDEDPALPVQWSGGEVTALINLYTLAGSDETKVSYTAGAGISVINLEIELLRADIHREWLLNRIAAGGGGASMPIGTLLESTYEALELSGESDLNCVENLLFILAGKKIDGKPVARNVCLLNFCIP